MIQFLKRRLQKFDPLIFSHFKNHLRMIEINYNIFKNRHFIPDPRNQVFIETSGVCNLLCKICGYQKKRIAKVIMPMDLFQNIVNQAVKMGFSRFGLTPLSGEPFVDNGFWGKLNFLDNHPQVEGYYFFSNFIVPDTDKISRLFTLQKLNTVHISLYGHDPESFSKITQRPKKLYSKLVENLNTLYQLYSSNQPFNIGLSWRTVPSFSENQSPNSDVQEIVAKFKMKHNIKARNLQHYNNWGGSGYKQ